MVEADAVVTSSNGDDGMAGGGGVDRCWGASADSTVAAFVVVDLAEALQVVFRAARSAAGLCGQPAFQGLVEAFDLALGLRVAGVAVLLSDAKVEDQCLNCPSPGVPGAKRVVKMRPLSVSVDAGSPWCSAAGGEGVGR